MKKLLFLIFIVSGSAWAERVNFVSNKIWNSGRWYAIGRLQKNSITWYRPGGKSGARSQVFDSCFDFLEDGLVVERPDPKLEVMISNGWILYEIDPLVGREEALFVSKDDGDCSEEVRTLFAIAGEVPDRINGFIFMSSDNTSYFNQEFFILTPPDRSDSDLQADVGIGFTKAVAAQRELGITKESFLMLPTAYAKMSLKALPETFPIGLTAHLDYALNVWEAAGSFNRIFSYWSAGAFYDFFYLGEVTYQLKPLLRYEQFLLGQFLPRAFTLITTKTVFAGLDAQVYFGRRWIAGAQAELGYTLDRSLAMPYRFIGRLGFRLSSSAYLISELLYRRVPVLEDGAETHIGSRVIFRLEL